MSTLLALPKQQRCVLEFMFMFYLANDQLPPFATIAQAFGYASNNAAADLVQKLGKKGMLEKNEIDRWKFSAVARAALQSEPRPPLKQK